MTLYLFIYFDLVNRVRNIVGLGGNSTDIFDPRVQVLSAEHLSFKTSTRTSLGSGLGRSTKSFIRDPT